MTKLYKNIILSVLTAIAFAFAGLFFVGCNKVDYSDVTIASNISSINLQVGESQNVAFTIENATDSFYKVLRFSVDNESVVKITNVKYDDNVATVSIEGLAGGSVNLMATSEEGYKWTTIRINVIEHSSSLSFDGSKLYLTSGSEISEASALKLTSSNYIFDANTTDKALTFYYLYQSENEDSVNIETLTFKGFASGTDFDFNDVDNIVMPSEPTLEFEGENTVEYNLNALRFDRAEIVNGVLNLYYNGEIVANSDANSELHLSSLSDALRTQKFHIITFYNYSVYENSTLSVKNYLHYMHEVEIYQNLGVKVYGGYLKTEGTGVEESRTVDFSSEYDVDSKIKIVTNNKDYSTYILKVTTAVEIEDLEFGIGNVGELLSIETYTREAWGDLKIGEINSSTKTDNVFYIMINTSSFANSAQKFDIFVRYEGMEDVENDFNVNFNPEISVDVNLVTTEILLNDVSATSYSSVDDRILIYNFYRYPEFGWRELKLSLSTGLDAEAVYSYATISFDSEIIDFKQGTNGEVVDDGKIFDISTSFFYRGRTDATESLRNKFTITIYYLIKENSLDENSNELITVSCDVYFDIIAGANSIARDERYGAGGEVIYIDMQSEGTTSLGDYLHTENAFQAVTVSHASGENVVSFIVDEDCCLPKYDVNNQELLYYALNLSVSPIKTGTGMYRVMLDNGVFVSVTINVINTLQTDNFGVELVSSDYVGYYEYKTTRFDEEATETYTNTLLLEILNNTDDSDNTYSVVYGSEVGIKFYGNILSNPIYTLENGNVLSVGSNGDLSYVITTSENGEALVTFEVDGYKVDGLLNRGTMSVNYYIEAKSYSLLDEFYLMNEGRYAVDNIVYYGQNQNSNLPPEATSVTFEVYAENTEAFGFYKYKISDNFIQDIIDSIEINEGELSSSNANGLAIAQLIQELIEAGEAGVTNPIVEEENPVILEVDESYVTSELQYKKYDRDYIYFYADANSRSLTTYAIAQIKITPSAGGLTSTYPLYLEFDNGIMFDLKNSITEIYTYNYNNIDYNIEISFDNTYSLSGDFGPQGEFDFSTFTYTQTAAVNSDFVLHSYIRQRNYTEMQYDANIVTSEYIEIERVSTASSIDEIAFTNGYLSDTFVVFVSPTDATNIDLKAQFVSTNQISRDLITTNIVEQGVGVYLVEISVEDFYNANSAIINTIETALSGTLYIYPTEWGEDYSVLGEHTPIKIDISYRNGSEANRYILDSPEDVLAINSNEETLSSHYEIRTNIDMSTVKGETIGFVINADGSRQLIGFSGSIVGTTSQAGISNFKLTMIPSKDNGSISALTPGENSSYYYAGLFAQINHDGYIKNLTISGVMDMDTTGYENPNFYIGLLAGVNYGKISNVSAVVSGASEVLVCNSGEFCIGGLVGLNGITSYNVDMATIAYKAGEIVQNFNSYVDKESEEEEEVKFTIEDKVGEFAGQSPKNIANFNAKLTITLDGTATSASVYAGGIAGLSRGDIYRIDNSGLNIYGYASYSSFTNIEVDGGKAKEIFAGGAVGYLQAEGNVTSNIIKTTIENSGGPFYVNANPIEFNDNALPRVTLFNLLVGGEVDVKNSADSVAVGGIVGYAGESGQQSYILGNISRTFVRGGVNTGGIVGVENNNGVNVNYLLHKTDENGMFVQTDESSRVVLENTINKIEAVDDGRGAFESSMMLLSGDTHKANYVDNENGVTEDVIVAIGNSYNNGRNYKSDGIVYALFDVCSYVDRGLNNNDEINKNDNSLTSYYGDYLMYDGSAKFEQFEFNKAEANLGIQDSIYAMKSESGKENVFVMFNFNGMLTDDAEGVAQDYIDASNINKFAPNSSLYPFALDTRDAQILSTSTNLLKVNADGSLTTYSKGLASVNLQSILNVQKSINIYLYIVNYLDTQSENSIFYSSNTTDSLNIISGSQVVVYGTRQTSVYAVPTYRLGEGNLSYEVANGERRDVIIEDDGTFLLNNVGIRLNTNDSVVVDATCENPLYTTYDVNGQSILFYGKGDNLQGTDTYNLTSYLETTVGDDVYRLAIGASRNTENPGVDINVEYKETATGINVSSNLISMKTNDVYNEKIYVTSRNNEFVYYEIFFTDNDNNEYKIQERMSNSWAGEFIEDELDDSEYKKYVLSYENYIKNGENEYNENLFNLVIDKDDVNKNNNEFSFAISVNKNSSMYLNRKNVNIYGTYRIVFYANEMYDGVHTNFIFYLSEAEITNVDAVNYSKMTDMSVRDDNIVPSQYGLLEINIDPIEAEFNTFKIENDSINYLEGAGEVDFTFMYQSTTDGVIRYLPDVNFGLNINGSLSFSYEEYIDYLEAKGESYNGKIHVRYLLGSLGVQDEMPIRFNIEVSYLSGQVEYEEVNLTTKLAHYAHLSFNDREESDIYYVARGLDYEMTLDFYGFGLNDISITMSDGSIATLVGEGRERSLKITDSVITPTDDIGYKLNIYVNASRVVDNVTVQYSEILTVYIMEFVFDYQYVIGQNEDLVRGMEEGVISTAVGNAYSLEVDIWDFLEYDDTNNSVIRNVQEFINSLTSNAEFKIYDASSGRDGLLLSSDTNIRSDYYYINGLTFTGIRLYEPEQDIYHFSMEAKFVRRNGLYVVDDDALDSQTIYTEFSFYIHQQSTDESPLPIETYEEFMNMEDGQYYILLNDIVLPNSDTAQPFTPITANVAGFDGNGYSLLLGGNYTFSGSNIGVFETIGATNDDVVVKNLTVELYLNTIFTVTSGNFTLGLIAGGNNAVITNCEVITNNNSALSVSCTASSSFVAGFVGRNSGIITNSRSSVSIFTNVNLSGFVGTNTGTISSSYFHKGSLRNETTTTSEYTAGFVINNSGTINTSYVSGEVNDNEEVYSRDENSFITSHNAISGFVFTNSGVVTNCYSNIYMNNTSSYASGFVFINESGGEVSSSFSTSVLASNSTLSYGFARANSGSIHDAYYLKDKNINESVGTVENGPNTSIEDLTIDEFSSGDENFAEHFQNFVFVNSRGYNAVWFYNNTNTSAYYNGQNFNLNRLELVAPNILAFSQRYLYSAEEVVDPETGVTTVVYHYVNTAESGESGSINNPIVLDNAENFEKYILNENNNNHYNHSYYRVINDIDYSEYDNNSELFKTRFMGYFEGNFLTISNVHMVTSERLSYAGFFAEVGSSTREGAIGTVMNFNLEPSEMVFTNTQVSGGIAGRVDSGVIANINIVSDDNIMVTANNIAGGIVGLAVGNYDIENVNSDASAKATYIPENGSSNTFNESSTDFSRNSYAGSVVGVASGNGSVNKVNVNSGVAVIGGTSGAIIGMLSREARASNLTLTVDTDLMINAYYYGGLVIGESAGMVDNVSVIGTGLYETIFNNIPNDPVAVGGVVGLMSNGSLNNVEANQSLSLSVATNTSGVSYLGGLIGSVAGSVDISNVDVQGSYIGFSVVGGLIGSVTEDNVVVNLKNISYTDGYLAVLSTQQSNASIGGVIGSATDSASINITAELSTSLKTNLTAYANTLMRENDADNTYLEFTEVLNAGENYALSTDMFTNDDRTTLNSQYVSEANKIEFEAHALAYVYGTILDIYLGEIVGNTLSSMVNVNNTISVMTASIESYNMGCVNPGTYTESAYITQGTYNYKLHTNSETLDGTGYIFTDYLDFSSTASESNVGHIIQDIETTYIPSTAVAGEEEGTVITTNSFGANFGDDFYVLPIYSHNVSYTFYMEGGESDHNLHLTNYGMGVSASFTTL